MVWVLITSANGRFSSNSDGSERLYYFEVQDWGLQVKDVLASAILHARSSSSVKLRIHLDHGASADLNPMMSMGDPVPSTAITGNLPKTVFGSIAGTLPYLRPAIAVSSTGATEEWVELKGLYMGGKAY